MKNVFGFGPKEDGGDLLVSRKDQEKRAVLIVGSGRSGTSLMALSLKALGAHVPPPEVPADDTNPAGFGESQWLVDFHTPLLRRHGVLLSDARPNALRLIAEEGFSRVDREKALEWLSSGFTESSTLILKDPRLTWFIDDWQSVLESLDVATTAIHMIRHPLEVISSKHRWYDPRRTRTGDYVLGAWINSVRAVDSSPVADVAIPVLHRDLLSNPIETVSSVARRSLPGVDPANYTELSGVLDKLFHPDRTHSHPGILDNEEPINPALIDIGERLFSSFIEETRGNLEAFDAQIMRQEIISEYDNLYHYSSRLIHGSQKANLQFGQKTSAERDKWRSEEIGPEKQNTLLRQELEKISARLRKTETALAKAQKHPLRFLAKTVSQRTKKVIGGAVKGVAPNLHRRLKNLLAK